MDGLGADADALIAAESLAAEFEQDALVLCGWLHEAPAFYTPRTGASMAASAKVAGGLESAQSRK
jgi:hypothetical protein